MDFVEVVGGSSFQNSNSRYKIMYECVNKTSGNEADELEGFPYIHTVHFYVSSSYWTQLSIDVMSVDVSGGVYTYSLASTITEILFCFVNTIQVH